MTQQVINTGARDCDCTGDPLRTAFTKYNANMAELFNMAGLAGEQLIVNTSTAANTGRGDTMSVASAKINSNYTVLFNQVGQPTYQILIGVGPSAGVIGTGLPGKAAWLAINSMDNFLYQVL